MANVNEQIGLFEFLRYLALVMGRKRLHPVRASVAQFVALGCKGTTGTGATVDAQQIGLELGVTERQVWRHVEWLVDNGWLEQTEKPTRGLKGKPGRRARYRLTRPTIDLGLTESCDTPAAHHVTRNEGTA